MDDGEGGDAHTVALVDGGGRIEGHLLHLGPGTGLAGVAIERLHVPGVRGCEVLGVGGCTQFGTLAARSPDLDRVAASGLGQAPHQCGHVPDMVGVQVRQEYLRRGGDRQVQAVEVGNRPRTQVEEEEVTLLVAHLDEDRC